MCETLNQGDTVRVSDLNSPYYGATGLVEENGGGQVLVMLALTGPRPFRFDQLEVVQRVGDAGDE